MLELIYDWTIGWIVNLIMAILISIGIAIRYISFKIIGRKKTLTELTGKNNIVINALIGFIFLVLILFTIGCIF